MHVRPLWIWIEHERSLWVRIVHVGPLLVWILHIGPRLVRIQHARPLRKMILNKGPLGVRIPHVRPLWKIIWEEGPLRVMLLNVGSRLEVWLHHDWLGVSSWHYLCGLPGFKLHKVGLQRTNSSLSFVPPPLFTLKNKTKQKNPKTV